MTEEHDVGMFLTNPLSSYTFPATPQGPSTLWGQSPAGARGRAIWQKGPHLLLAEAPAGSKALLLGPGHQMESTLCSAFLKYK